MTEYLRCPRCWSSRGPACRCVEEEYWEQKKKEEDDRLFKKNLPSQNKPLWDIKPLWEKDKL